MRGVVLAGGLGTRFHPVTRVVNKHLLDVYDEPMIFYPLKTLARAGIKDVVVVAGKEIEQFRALLGEGRDLGVNIAYAEQEGELGIAHALSKAQPFVEDDLVTVILGDNIFQDDIKDYVARFEKRGHGAQLLLKSIPVDDAKRFGVAYVEGDRIISIQEKPDHPSSGLAVTGCYMYDSRVWGIIGSLEPSWRGEYEITDVNNAYVRRNDASFEVLRGWWTDAGTPASKLKASILVALAKGVAFQA